MRFQPDAVANVPPMKIRRNGTFRWSGDVEKDGTSTMQVSSRITGGRAKGKVTLTRPDSDYDAGMIKFGVCSAHDRAWTARR